MKQKNNTEVKEEIGELRGNPHRDPDDSLKNAVKGYIKLLLILLLAAVYLLLKVYVAEPVVVSGDSMNNTLLENDLLIVKTNEWTIERYDIVVITKNRKRLIKRVIGLPNETVQIIGGQVLIDGNPLEKYSVCAEAGIASEPLRLSDTGYFLMGDNRDNSFDSRAFGEIEIGEIDGVVQSRLFPGYTVFSSQVNE